MKVQYMAVPTKLPVPSLGGLQVRHRPVLAVLLTGPGTPQLRDGLLDTGSDDTVFTDAVAAQLGIDLSKAEQRLVMLASRARPILCRYASVQLRISDGTETFLWTAVVGFVPGPLHYALLGQAGFLQYFGADFDGEAKEVMLTPKPAFPGRRI